LPALNRNKNRTPVLFGKPAERRGLAADQTMAAVQFSRALL